MIVLDTDFFSSFFKIGRLKLILDVSGEEKVVIPGTVYDELKRTNFFDEILYSMAFSEDDIGDERYILVKKVDLSICDSFIGSEEITGLGKGELGCMVLAKEHGAEILISDRHADRLQGIKISKQFQFQHFCCGIKEKEKFPGRRLKELSRIYARKIFMRLAKKWRGNYYVRR